MSDKVLFIGDSITHGTDWAKFINFAAVENIAVPGFLTDDVLAQMVQIREINPKVISMLIGTNDFGNIEIDRTGEDTGERVLQIINEILNELPEVKIVVSPILPRSAAFTQRIQTANKIVTSFIHERVSYLDTWQVLAEDDYLRPEFLLQDGFDAHLSDEGYLAWAGVLIPELNKLTYLD
jgi:lysophospholipase L1-like esterase